MPRGQRVSADLDFRAYPYLERGVNEVLELTYLRSGADPDWERVHQRGEDITDQPERWTPYQRARRLAFETRVASYRARGLM
jgi:hypothetical protein